MEWWLLLYFKTEYVWIGREKPFTWIFSFGKHSKSSSINSLVPGFYNLTVTDVYGCTYDEQFTINEPNCKVLAALANGEISNHRYQNYLNMLENEESIYRSSWEL